MTHLYIYIHQFFKQVSQPGEHQHIFGVLEILVIDMTSDDLMTDMISHG